METAVEINTKLKDKGFIGDARLYRLTAPLEGYDYVVVSALSFNDSGAIDETYIFGSDDEGNVLNWGELPGSLRGTLDHAEVLREAGYEIEKL